jgi:malonyl-CoA O-methyltransferase
VRGAPLSGIRVKSIASIYFSAMSQPVVDLQARRLDVVAVNAALLRLARTPQAPWLHAEVARRMAEKLQLIRLKPQRLIDWWSVLGAGAESLDQAYPQAKRLAVEPDALWAQRSREQRQRPWWSPQRWTGGRAQVLLQGDDIPGGAELVWANMMLHMVADPPGLIARWHQLLSVDGFVMFSCLGPGTLRELRAIYERRGWPAPTPGFVDMHDLGDMLVQAGFADPVMDQEVLTLRWDSPASLLAELRSLGGNTAPDRAAGLRTPRWQRELERELVALAGTDGKIGLSFEVAYGHAFKGGPRIRAGEATKVSLDDMRAMVRSSHGGGKGRRPLG